MAKKDTTAAIKAANNQDVNPDLYSQKQLDQLLTAAERGEDGRKDFDALVASFDSEREAAQGTPAAPQPAPAKLQKPVTVRVHPDIAGFGGEFTDPDTKATIGAQAATVETTPFIKSKLKSGEIVEDED